MFAGNVEFYADDGKWHYFYDSNWTKADADVVCKDIGFQEATEVRQSKKGEDDSVVCKDYSCSGRESYLVNCHQSTVNYTRCANKTIASVVCKHDGT